MPASTAADEAILRFSDVAFSWRESDAFRLEIESFAVRRCESLLVMGPSGSGKSTLLSLACGIVSPQQGEIEVAGTTITGLRGAALDRFRAEHFGIIFQMFNLLPYGSVVDNVLLPLRFARARRSRAARDGEPAGEAQRLLVRLGLDPALHRRSAPTLSVGQQQRVAVARALIGNPAIVIADEPTSALDRDHRHAFLDLLFEEAARAGATLVMVSHDATMAPRFERTVELGGLARPA
ncbi:MAG: ABC transporter ATP-binding protein [Rhodospirillales bacterium]|nr:ABC transporter ATP-binding protein [Rhodospirillales bacterium]